MATIVCSHGFGVRADARGLFTDLANALPEHQFIMFDYNQVLSNGDLAVAPLDKQASTLQSVLNEHDTVILLAHSQGCVVAGLVDLSRVNRVIFLAPPVEVSMQRVIDTLSKRPGAVINLDGMSKLPRRDGTTTQISREYIQSVNNVNPHELYQNVAEKRPTTIIRATEDEVLGLTNVDEVDGITLIDLPSSHDFQGEDRQQLIDTLKALLA